MSVIGYELRHIDTYRILSYKSKNVRQILTLKTRGRLIRLSSFGQQLFQGCLCKSMADSCCEMLAKRRQCGSMTATADDTESAADTPTPIGKERRSSPVTSTRRHRPRTTRGLHRVVAGGSAAACRRCLHAAVRSTTAKCPVRTLPTAAWRRRSRPSVDSYAPRVSNFGRFLTSKERIDLYANRFVREYILYVNFHVQRPSTL